MKQDDEEGNVNNLGNYIQLLLSGKKHQTAIKNYWCPGKISLSSF